MYETQVTVVGNLVTDVDPQRLPDGTAVANFRVGSTERRFDRATGSWVDGDRLYVDVRCRRDLAENSGVSLVKGDPVVVTGRIYTRSYEHQGQRRSSITLDAHSVAADLARCTVVLTRTRRGSAVADRTMAETRRGDATAAARPAGVDEAGGNGGRPAAVPGGAAAPPTDPDPDRSRPLVSAAPGGEGSAGRNYHR